MKPFSAATRAENLERLEQDQFDVLVIGGGITGAGVALDAAARGYRVALVEKADFASGTSSKSTKLVHGGIRYLPQFDVALVREALVERGILRQNAPFLVEPLTFVLPLYADAKKPVGVPITPPNGYGLGHILGLGLLVYDVMAGRRGMARHRRISAQEALALAPALRSEGLQEAFLYTDGQTNDTQLTLTVLRTAAQLGALIVNYTEVVGFRKADGRLNGAHVRDVLGNHEHTISARHIINAAGVFAGRVEALTGDESNVSIDPSKGVHLVVAKERVRLGDTAIVLPETDDKRILFVNPWGARAIIGTTDTGRGDLDEPAASPDDIAYLLRHVNRYLNVDLTHDDILSVYAGHRPLVKSKRHETARLSRTHVVLQEGNGMVTVVGGKLTTYRRMAQDAVDVIAKRDGMPRAHPTNRLLLTGAVDWSHIKPRIAAQGQRLALPDDVIQHLSWNFGGNALAILDMIQHDAALGERLVPDLPYVRAEVIYSCRFEMTIHLDDLLARRTRIVLEDRDRGLEVATAVASLMAHELGWSSDRTHTEVEKYQSKVGRLDAKAGYRVPAVAGRGAIQEERAQEKEER